MKKTEIFPIFQAILMFYDLDTLGYIKDKLKISQEEVLLASRIFKELRFFQIKQNENKRSY